MHKTLYTSLVAALLTSGAAFAEGFYIRGFGGISNLSDTDVTLGASSGAATFDAGTAFGGSIGYEYADSPWRSELEFAYRGADADALPAAIGTAGDFASTALMVNGIYELGQVGRWQPYVGAGIGFVTEIDFDIDGVGEYTDRGGVAAQAIIGAEYGLTDQVFLTGELRYFSAGSLDLSDGTDTLSADYSTTDLNLGVRFSF